MEKKLKDGDHCIVLAGTHKGKSGVVRDIHTSKTGHITITVVQKDGVRFKTLGRNVEVHKQGLKYYLSTALLKLPAMFRFVSVLLIFTLSIHPGFSQSNAIRVIMIGAHPDDCDQGGGGTAILLASMGHAVKFVSVTNGDAGHQSMGGGALAKRRMAEAKEAGKRFGVSYDVLDNHDGELTPNLNVRLQIIRKIREWDADVVIAPRPNDYHPDHRYTGVLVQDAAYMVAVPNVAPDVKPLKKNPIFLYFQDRFQRPNPFRPDVVIDITSVFDKKIYAMAAHESQFFEWLPWIGGYLSEVPAGGKERLDWLAKSRTRPLTSEIEKSIEKWYGASKVNTIKYVEAFEICEYGSQPKEDDIRRIFPMLKK